MNGLNVFGPLNGLVATMRSLIVSLLVAGLLACPLNCLAELPDADSARVAVCDCESSCSLPSLPPGPANRPGEKNPNRDSESEDGDCLCGGAVVATSVRVVDVFSHTASASVVDHVVDVDIPFGVLISASLDLPLRLFSCESGHDMRIAISSFLL